MTDVAVLFHHPTDGCGLVAETQEVIFKSLTLAGLEALLNLDDAFWGSPDRPKCEISGKGFQVMTNCQGVIAKEIS